MAGALGAQDLGRERIGRNERTDAHHRAERLVELVVIVFRLRLHGCSHVASVGWTAPNDSLAPLPASRHTLGDAADAR